MKRNLLKTVSIYVCVILCVLTILVSYQRITIYRKKWRNKLDPEMRRYVSKAKIMVLMLVTKNYDKIGSIGGSFVYEYCKRNGYGFEMYRDKLNDNLHINFSKFEMAKDAMNRNPDYDYFVVIDADVVFTTYEMGIRKLISVSDEPRAKMFAPKDVYKVVGGVGYSGTSMNAGFMIFHKTAYNMIVRYLEITEHTECGQQYNNKHPRNQNVFDKCFKSSLNEGEFSYVPWELVGVNVSKYIKQVYDKKKYVEKYGMYSNPFIVDILNKYDTGIIRIN